MMPVLPPEGTDVETKWRYAGRQRLKPPILSTTKLTSP
jgi:hypothetical protein